MAVALAPDRWKRIRPLLDRALDLDADARANFLSELSTEHNDLREDLERLIRRHEETAEVDQPAAALAGAALAHTDPGRPAPFVGKRAGPFELTRLLGAGGMGAVYEAQRVEGGFRQTVAIKLVAGIHPGLNARFERERQILADLRHPCVAQLLDGGETSDGMPYFALEYIEGQPITDYADQVGADTDQRLRLLIEVAEALAYAHRRHVIHRDIKPSNILVSRDGHVKLLDFGIAKLLKGHSGPALTRQQLGPMTPEYAAPEQFRGGELGPATDVYQFGVLVFRLLTGRLPYRANADDGLAWARAVSEDEPMSLTEALRESRRSPTLSGETTLRRLTARGGIDLNAVVRRLLAKQPDQRYASMDAVIAELQAYLTPGARSALRAPRWRWWLAGPLLVLAAAASAPWWWTPLQEGNLWIAREWTTDSTLQGLGLRSEQMHATHAQTESMLQQALRTEASGDARAAMALLETLHESDPSTPVPAILLSYWSSNLGSQNDVQRWQQAAQQRLARVDDPYLQLLNRFVMADVADDGEGALRYSGALLQMRPDAWFLHLARAHRLNQLDMREAALKELQAIDVDTLGHRRLADAIADRASLGDLPGAWAQLDRLGGRGGDDPQRAYLVARLLYTAGDLRGARDEYLRAIELARRNARFDLQSRSQLWAGIYSGALGEYERAVPLLRDARTLLSSRQQHWYAADASLALAQIAAMQSDATQVRREIDAARAELQGVYTESGRTLVALMAARLAGDAITDADLGAATDEVEEALLSARRALASGDPAQARQQLARAGDTRLAGHPLCEEAAWLARELGVDGCPLQPIDPPFGPYGRYAARWPLGQGASIAPAPRGP